MFSFIGDAPPVGRSLANSQFVVRGIENRRRMLEWETYGKVGFRVNVVVVAAAVVKCC